VDFSRTDIQEELDRDLTETRVSFLLRIAVKYKALATARRIR
jgi:hypothetical protein